MKRYQPGDSIVRVHSTIRDTTLVNAVHVDTPGVNHGVNDGLGVDDVVVTRGPVAAVHGVTQGARVVAVNGAPLGPVCVTGGSQGSISSAAVEAAPTIL